MNNNPVNLDDLLDAPIGSGDTPAEFILPPEGTYHGTITGFRRGATPPKPDKPEGTPYVEFTAIPTAPGPDIDPNTLEGVDLSKFQLKTKFFTTAKAIYRLDAFLKSLGFDMSGTTRNEALPQTVGAAVILKGVHVLSATKTDAKGNPKTFFGLADNDGMRGA